MINRVKPGPENYSLEVMDYCDMMKAWEAELLGQYAEAIGPWRARAAGRTVWIHCDVRK